MGSYNLDPRSSKLNTEMGVLVTNTELAQHLGKWRDASIDQRAYKLGLESIEGEYGKEPLLVWYDLSVKLKKRYEEAPKAGFWKKLGSSILSISPIDDHL